MDSIFKPTLRLMAGRALAFGGTFLIPVVLSRVFAPAEFGTYKQLLLLYSTLYAVVPLGMAESLYYFIPRRPDRAGAYVANAMLFLGLAGLGTLALLGAGLAPTAAAEHILMLGAFTGLMLAATPLEIVMISRKSYTTAARTYAASDLVRAALFTLPAFVSGRLDWLLWGAVLFAALRLVLTLAYMTSELGKGLRPDPSALRTQLAYALPFGAAALLEIAQATYHQYAVSYHYDAAAFALYSVGCLQIPIVDFLAGPAGNVMMVRMGELRENSEAVRQVWHEMTRRLALVFVPMVILLELLSWDLIVLLFTPRYADSVPIFRIWSVTILLSALQTDAVLRVYARTRFLLGLNLLRLVLIASIVGPALRIFGLQGAAMATVATLVVTKGVALARLRSLMGAPPASLAPWKSLAAISAAAAAAAGPALVARAGTMEATIARVAVVAAIYGAAYLALAAAWLLTGDERRQLAAAVTPRWPWLVTDRAAARS
jgi:O-antigen/teichoic acid export membrane protein